MINVTNDLLVNAICVDTQQALIENLIGHRKEVHHIIKDYKCDQCGFNYPATLALWTYTRYKQKLDQT